MREFTRDATDGKHVLLFVANLYSTLCFIVSKQEKELRKIYDALYFWYSHAGLHL